RQPQDEARGRRDPNEGALPIANPAVSTNYEGVIPQMLAVAWPGPRATMPSPLRNALGGQVMGSTARPRRRRAGSRVSPVKTMRWVKAASAQRVASDRPSV